MAIEQKTKRQHKHSTAEELAQRRADEAAANLARGCTPTTVDQRMSLQRAFRHRLHTLHLPTNASKGEQNVRDWSIEIRERRKRATEKS